MALKRLMSHFRNAKLLNATVANKKPQVSNNDLKPKSVGLAQRVNQQNDFQQKPLLRIDPAKAEKYRLEGERRIREQMLKAENERLEAKRLKNKAKNEKRKAKKEEGKSWFQSIVDMGKEILPHALPLLLGAGDYTQEDGVLAEQEAPKTNSLLAAQSKGEFGSVKDVPMMHTTGNQTRITHREYLGDIYSSTSEFVNDTFPINPGMNESFPWASPIANQYTGWIPLGMAAEFISEGSEYTNSAGLGYVALGAQYNPSDAEFSSKRDMLNSQFSVARKPSQSFQCWIECARSERISDHLWTRAVSPPANNDIKLYDLCNLNVAVGGNVVSDVIIGELWITYDILLLLPKSTLNINPNQLQFATSSTGGVANATPLGSGWSSSNTFLENTFNVPYTSGTVLTFPKGYPGQFSIELRWFLGAAVGTPAQLPGRTYSPGVSLVTTWGTGGVGMTSAAGGSQLMITIIVNVSDKGGTITFDGAGNLAFTPTFQMLILQTYNGPQKTHGHFDRLGRNRSEKYNNFMKGSFLEQEIKKHKKKFIDTPSKGVDGVEAPLGNDRNVTLIDDYATNHETVLRFTENFELLDILDSLYIEDLKTRKKIDGSPLLSCWDAVDDSVFDSICNGIFMRHKSYETDTSVKRSELK